jgi:hypothetical protein
MTTYLLLVHNHTQSTGKDNKMSLLSQLFSEATVHAVHEQHNYISYTPFDLLSSHQDQSKVLI